jgi:hypothetical protein
VQAPVERLDAVGQAAQAAAERLVGAADAVVGDIDPQLPALAPDVDRGGRRPRVLGDVGERLGGDE